MLGGGPIKHLFRLGCSMSSAEGHDHCEEHTQFFTRTNLQILPKTNTHNIRQKTRATRNNKVDNGVSVVSLLPYIFETFSHSKSLVTNCFRNGLPCFLLRVCFFPGTTVECRRVGYKNVLLGAPIAPREGKHVIRYWWRRRC